MIMYICIICYLYLPFVYTCLLVVLECNIHQVTVQRMYLFVTLTGGMICLTLIIKFFVPFMETSLKSTWGTEAIASLTYGDVR